MNKEDGRASPRFLRAEPDESIAQHHVVVVVALFPPFITASSPNVVPVAHDVRVPAAWSAGAPTPPPRAAPPAPPLVRSRPTPSTSKPPRRARRCPRSGRGTRTNDPAPKPSPRVHRRGSDGGGAGKNRSARCACPRSRGCRPLPGLASSRRRCLDLTDRLCAEASVRRATSPSRGRHAPHRWSARACAAQGRRRRRSTAARARPSDETLLGPTLAPSPFLVSGAPAGRPAPAGDARRARRPRGAEEVVPRPLPTALALPGTRRDARARVGLRPRGSLRHGRTRVRHAISSRAFGGHLGVSTRSSARASRCAGTRCGRSAGRSRRASRRCWWRARRGRARLRPSR